MGVDSQNLAYGFRVIFAGFPSSLGFGVGGQSSSNFLALTVKHWHVLDHPLYLHGGLMVFIRWYLELAFVG